MGTYSELLLFLIVLTLFSDRVLACALYLSIPSTSSFDGVPLILLFLLKFSCTQPRGTSQSFSFLQLRFCTRVRIIHDTILGDWTLFLQSTMVKILPLPSIVIRHKINQ